MPIIILLAMSLGVFTGDSVVLPWRDDGAGKIDGVGAGADALCCRLHAAHFGTIILSGRREHQSLRRPRKKPRQDGGSGRDKRSAPEDGPGSICTNDRPTLPAEAHAEGLANEDSRCHREEHRWLQFSLEEAFYLVLREPSFQVGRAAASDGCETSSARASGALLLWNGMSDSIDGGGQQKEGRTATAMTSDQFWASCCNAKGVRLNFVHVHTAGALPFPGVHALHFSSDAASLCCCCCLYCALFGCPYCCPYCCLYCYLCCCLCFLSVLLPHPGGQLCRPLHRLRPLPAGRLDRQDRHTIRRGPRPVSCPLYVCWLCEVACSMSRVVAHVHALRRDEM